jgi:DNA-binding NarL/FixJ family response regulator
MVIMFGLCRQELPVDWMVILVYVVMPGVAVVASVLVREVMSGWLRNVTGDFLRCCRGLVVWEPSKGDMSAMGQGIYALVVDSQPLMREGLTAILKRDPDISIADTATSGEEVVSCARKGRHSVVVINHDPPSLDGIQLAGELGRIGGDDFLPVLLLGTASTRNGDLLEALRRGARGVIDKNQAPELLVGVVRAVSLGVVVIPSPAAPRLASTATAKAVVPDIPDALSSRELEVYRLVVRGYNNREIADSLSLSMATVKSHVHSVYRKLDVRDRVQAVIRSYETGSLRWLSGSL